MKQSALLLLTHTSRRITRRLSRLPKLCLYVFLSLLPTGFKKRLAITYANEKKTDGLGAQLQRLVAIRALAMRIKINYLHNKISVLTVHPLDNLEHDVQVAEFLEKVDLYFHLDSTVEKTWADEQVSIDSLSILSILKNLLRSVIQKKNILIRVIEPYAVMELLPSDYKRVIPLFYKFPRTASSPDEIVMHYRYGVGGNVIQHGEKLPRQINLLHFRDVIRDIPTEYSDKLRTLRVLTDAPQSAKSFTPNKNQLHLWEGTPNFNNGSVIIEAFSFDEILGGLGLDLVVEYGGDAVDSLLIMSRAKVLILSRSSLSYVGALFNENQPLVYSAPKFWHPKMKTWN